MYCAKCAAPMADRAPFCPSCGAAAQPLLQPARQVSANGSDWLTTLLLSLFLGKLGVHRFYTGHTITGLLMLCTCGGCGIWWMIDVVMIITESFKDYEGRPLVKRN